MMHSYRKYLCVFEHKVARVLILVLMDDALVPSFEWLAEENAWVLILVLMDDALVLTQFSSLKDIKVCLNPCFNGWCTRTDVNTEVVVNDENVLILVLMDDALVQGEPCSKQRIF